MAVGKSNNQRAKEVYNALISIIETKGWRNQKDKINFVITSAVKIDGKPINFMTEVMPDFKIAWFRSDLPFLVPINKRAEVSAAVNVVNLSLVDATFTFNIRTGQICLRMSTAYTDTELSKDNLERMVIFGIKISSDFIDPFLHIATGEISLSEFIEENE